jgi:VWFA-related protein
MRLATVAVLTLLTVFSYAQVRETLEIRLIEVDAVVTDRDGKPVTGLTVDDFELFENGKRQQITNFAEFRIEQLSAVTAAAPEAPAAAPVQAQAPPPRTIVLYIDAVPVHGPARKRLFDRLRTLVDRTMREGDRAQVVIWRDRGGLRPVSKLTKDREEIKAAIAQAEAGHYTEASGPSQQEYAQFFNDMAAANPTSAGGAATPTPLALGTGDAQAAASSRIVAELELAVMRRKTASMQRLISSLGTTGGRSVFVYVSELFPMVAGKRAATSRLSTGEISTPRDAALRAQYTTRGLLEKVIATANASGVSFYALRPERIITPMLDLMSGILDDAVVNTPAGGTDAIADQVILQNEVTALSLVAEETGGMFGVGPAQLEEVIERVVQDLGSYYTLAYRAPSDGSDRARKVEVRAKNRDYTVRARKTIVEKSDRTRARDLVIARLFETGPASDFRFGVTTGKPVSAGRNRTTIPVELSIPAEQLTFEPEGKDLVAKFSVLAVSGTDPSRTGEFYEQSQRVIAAPGKPIRGNVKYSFSILHDQKPGTLAVAVFDEKSGIAGTRLIRLGANQATVEAMQTADSAAEPAWIEQATRERKMIVTLYRPRRCNACAAFERESLQHPAIQRRLQQVLFVNAPAAETSLAVFDQGGTLRARWNGVPKDTTTFGTILDGILGAAPHFRMAIELTALGPYEGELEAAVGLSKLGRREEAREAIDRARAHGSTKTRELAIVADAMLDLNEGKSGEALRALEDLTKTATAPDTIASAWVGIGMIHRANGRIDDATRAFTSAIETAGGTGTEMGRTALQAREALRSTPGTSAIRILPIPEQIVAGKKSVRTSVESAAVAKVTFTVDGAERATVTKPPFAATIDFGRLPQAQTIGVVAHDVNGNELGRSELVVNNAGETFWLRLTEPREGPAAGKVHVSAMLRAPAAHSVKRVVLSWNDAERAVLTAAPWETDVEVPAETGILRAVAELDDGRTAEDAVLLNGSGFSETSTVPLVELPITIAGGPVKAEDVVVREGSKQLQVESVTAGADAPLTVGLLIDSSGSMQKHLPDVQEAAIRFLDTALGENGRAFLVTFDSEARLVQAPTANRDTLRQRVLNIRPAGNTALYDAMILGLLQFEGVKGRRALIVFSDGADAVSRYRRENVAELAKRSNIPIYLIVAPQPSAPRPMVTQVAPGTGLPVRGGVAPNLAGVWISSVDEMRKVSNATGGRLHTIRDLKELAEVYGKIEADLRAQTLVLVRTEAGKSANDWRAIDVDVKGRRDVRAPEGYYAAW